MGATFLSVLTLANTSTLPSGEVAMTSRTISYNTNYQVKGCSNSFDHRKGQLGYRDLDSVNAMS